MGGGGWDGQIRPSSGEAFILLASPSPSLGLALACDIFDRPPGSRRPARHDKVNAASAAKNKKKKGKPVVACGVGICNSRESLEDGGIKRYLCADGRTDGREG